MNISKKQIAAVISLLAIVFSLPIAIFLTKKGQEIRPRALQGQANFLLSTDSTTSTVGKVINVVVSMQLTDSTLKTSGVDFLLLYDKSKLDVINIVPQIKSVDPNAAFTDAPIVSSGGIFDDTYNFIRVAEIARMGDQFLPAGTFTLAKITFVGRAQGSANIKFPDDNKYLQIVGTGTYIGSTANPSPTRTLPNPISGAVNLSILPSPQVNIPLNGVQTFTLQAVFPNASASRTLNSFKGEINFPANVLQMPAGQYVDTSQSGFNTVVRVDGPTQANGSGKIVINLAASPAGSGPATDKPITIATFKLSGKAPSAIGIPIGFGPVAMMDNQNQSLTINPIGSAVTVQ